MSKRIRVLIVDDSLFMRAAISKTLPDLQSTRVSVQSCVARI